METEAGVSKLKTIVSHHEAEIAELRADQELAVEYLKAAMESLGNPDDRATGLLTLRTGAKAVVGRHPTSSVILNSRNKNIDINMLF